MNEKDIWLRAWFLVARSDYCKAPETATHWATQCLADYRKEFPVEKKEPDQTKEPLPRLLQYSERLKVLANACDETGRKCDADGLPPEYGDWERGRAAAYRTSSDVIKHILVQSEKQ